MGIGGTAVIEKGGIKTVRDVTSLSVRIPREKRGCAEEVLRYGVDLSRGLLLAGAPSSGKTTLLRKRLAESTAPKTILIVPEQYTFESERALLMEYGAETANRVQVYSFTRLAQAAFLQYGGGAGKRLTDGGRRILMTLALENCADQLTLFKKKRRSHDGRFIEHRR